MNSSELLQALNQKGFSKDRLFSELRGHENKERIRQTAYFDESMDEAKREAARYLGSEIEEIPYSAYRLYETTGDRKLYGTYFSKRRARFNAMAFLSLFAEEPDPYRKDLENIIWAICNEYTWAQPAHLKNSLSIEENALCPHFEAIDLTAAETAFALAEVTSLLQDQLEPAVVARARAEVFRRVLNPYLKATFFYNWEMSESNWAAVCAGSVGAAALYLMDDTEVLTKLLLRVLDALKFYMGGFGRDGACREGLAYWSYGTTFYIAFAQLLKQRTLGQADLLQEEKFREVALFMERCRLYGNTVVNFSDSAPSFLYRCGYLHKLKELFPEIGVPPAEYRMTFHDGLYRWAGYIRDLAWRRNLDDEETEAGNFAHCFPDAQWLISRRKVGKDRVCFAAIGGNNGESHNHNDIGHFIFQKNGKFLFCDIGAGEYVKGYFGEERYNFFNTSSQGHSVPVVNGSFQSAGREFCAQDFSASNGEEEDCVSMNLAGAYENSGLESLKREFRFQKNGRLILTDCFAFRQDSTVTERFIVCADEMPQCPGPGEIEIKNGKETALLRFPVEQLELAGIFETSYTLLSPNQKVYYIDITLKQGQNTAKFEIL